jgi:glycerol dehydrogenase
MFTKAVFPGKYIQGQCVLSELPKFIDLLGTKGLILASPTVKSKILPALFKGSLPRQVQVEQFRGECCEQELNRVSRIIGQEGTNVIVGMGGGKTIDTAKIAADRAGIPVIVLPTIASTDAPCSGCAVTYTAEGAFEAVHYQKMNPSMVLVDMDIIASAPTRFLISGMGDALATWFEARSCVQTHSQNECGGFSTLAGLQLARLCYDTLLKYGVQASADNDAHLVTEALSNITEANILLSGIGFESSGLATAHSIHNGLTALEETHTFYHGEKVAFGVLTGLHLTSASAEEMDTVYSFCESIDLPTTFADLGLKNVSSDQLERVAEKACAPAESIKNEVVKVNPLKVLQAMIKADAMGIDRKVHASYP